MARKYIFAATSDTVTAAQAVAACPDPPRVVVTSPTPAARAAAETALQGRYAFVTAEPLLAARSTDESGADVLGRLGQALRSLPEYEARTLLVVLDGLDLLGARVFVLDEAALERLADGLVRALPLP